MGSFIDDLTVHCILGFQIRNRLPRPVSRSHIRAAIDILHRLQFCLKALENEMLILRYDLLGVLCHPPCESLPFNMEGFETDWLALVMCNDWTVVAQSGDRYLTTSKYPVVRDQNH